MKNRQRRDRYNRQEDLRRDSPYPADSRYGSSRDRVEFDRDASSESYFGGGRQNFGDGLSSSERYRGTNSQWRDANFGGRSYREDRPYAESGRFGRDDPRLGYVRGPGTSYGHGMDRSYPEYTENEPYGSRTYGARYPESEEGYLTDRERYEERGWWDKASDEVSSWFGDDEAAHRREMDQRYGRYSGVGPKGYTRSDDRIKEDVNDRLTYHAYLDASDIDVQVDDGDVVLTGTVPTKYEKRYAEDIADNIYGVKNVENRLRVNSQAWSGRTAGTYSPSETPAYSGETEKSKTAGQS
ncbi:MAG: BON domain-containing protein [Pyrinomonadaceae bacterium]